MEFSEAWEVTQTGNKGFWLDDVSVDGTAVPVPLITSQPASQSVNAGASASFSVTATSATALSYQWKKGGVDISGATSSTYTIPSTVVGDAGSYTVAVTNADGTTLSAAATLTVNVVAPNITADPVGATVNVGSPASFSVTATGTAPLSYQWKKDTVDIPGATNSTLNIASAVLGDAGSYTVVVTNTAGSATSAAAVLTVNVPAVAPSITTDPVGATVNVGAPASFTVTASGTAPLSYQWKKGGVDFPGATNSTLNIAAAQLADAGSYTVVVTNTAGSATSAAAVLTVNVPVVAPAITTDPVSQTVSVGTNVTFSVTATGTAPLSYQWKKGGIDLAGETNATLNIASAQLADAGSYTVVVSNIAGSATSAAAVLTVSALPLAPTITTQPASQSVVVGAPVSFSVTATGTAPLTYQWKKGGVDISGATNATYSIASAQTTDAGSYTVVINNITNAPVTSSAATLTVIVPAAITTQPASSTVTAGSAASFTVVATGTAPLTYQWKKGGVDISGATSATLSFASAQTTDAGSYTVVVNNAAATPVTSSAATLTVNIPTSAPTISTQPASATVTVGSAASFTVVATGNPTPTYQWKKGGVDITGATSATYNIASAQTTDAGSYTVVVSNGVGSPVTSSAATLTVNAPVSITTQPASSTVTVGATVNFSVTATGTAPLTYQWRKGTTNITGATSATYSIASAQTTDAGSYNVIVTNVVGSVTSANATLTVNLPQTAPTITTQPANVTVTSGSAASFTVAATGNPTPTYQWQRSTDGITFTNVTGATSATYNIPSATLANSGTYRAVVTNIVGSVNSTNATLTVNATFAAPVPDGFAASATGGSGTGSTEVLALTPAAFRTAAESTSTQVITVSGILNLGATPVAVKSNKTIQGADGNATLVGNLNLGTGVTNVIIRGLNLTNPGTTISGTAYTDGGTALTIAGGKNVYVTQCSFFDTADQAIAITNGADNITVSWCEFYYTAAQTIHRWSVQIGNATGETAPINVTLHHNRWFTNAGTNVDQRIPLSTYGRVHMYNNSIAVTGNTDGTVSSDNSHILSERNTYNGVVNPLARLNVNNANPIGRILAIDNVYTATTGTAAYNGVDSVFTPPYGYDLQTAAAAVTSTTATAGNDNGANDASPAAIGTATITSPSATVETGASFTLTANVTGITAANYQWRLNNIPVALTTTPTLTINAAVSSSAGKYTVVANGAAGEAVVSAPYTLTVNEPADSGGGSSGGAPSLWMLSALAVLTAFRLRIVSQRRF